MMTANGFLAGLLTAHVSRSLDVGRGDDRRLDGVGAGTGADASYRIIQPRIFGLRRLPTVAGFSSIRVAAVENDLWLVPSTVAGARQVADDHALEIDAHWSPDGKTMVVEYDQRMRSSLMIDECDGSRRRQLTRGCATTSVRAVSPDGRHLAFESDAQSREMNITISPVDHLNPRSLMKSEAIRAAGRLVTGGSPD